MGRAFSVLGREAELMPEAGEDGDGTRARHETSPIYRIGAVDATEILSREQDFSNGIPHRFALGHVVIRRAPIVSRIPLKHCYVVEPMLPYKRAEAPLAVASALP